MADLALNNYLIADGEPIVPAQFVLVKPKGLDGQPRDQTSDAANHMRYAASLPIRHLSMAPAKNPARTCIIVGGAPSIKQELPKIKALAAVSGNVVFALNFTHNWLIENGVIPAGCVFFEIDAEPENVLSATQKGVTYYVCSHCHQATFDALRDRRVVLWHSSPNSEGEKNAYEELYQNEPQLAGGISTFLRSLSVAMALGYRNFELFGVDSSYPDDSPTTHVEGYPSIVTIADGFYIWARDDTNKAAPIRRFKTVSYLGLQVEEFKKYCEANHHLYGMRVHGPGLLPYLHQRMWPAQYE